MPGNQGMPSKTKIEENIKKNSIDMCSRKMPHCSVFLSNTGPIIIGTPSMAGKLKTDIKEWDVAIIADQEFLNNNVQENMTTLATEKGNSPPPLLPADLPLMRFRELTKYTQKILLKTHWASGGKGKRVIPGHPDFQAPFWPEDIWPWHQVNKPFQNMRRKDFPGAGNLTEFLKKVVKNYFDQENIDPENHVTELFTDRQRKRRQKIRGVMVSSKNASSNSSNSSKQNIDLPQNPLYSSSVEGEESVEGEIRRKMPDELNQTRDDSTDLSDLDRSEPSNVVNEDFRTNVSPVPVPNNMETDDNVTENLEDVREGVDVDDRLLEEQRSFINVPPSWNDDADITLSEDISKDDTEKISFEKEKTPSNNADLQQISDTELQSFNPDRRLTSTFQGNKDLEEILEGVEFIISDDTNAGLGDSQSEIPHEETARTEPQPQLEEDEIFLCSNCKDDIDGCPQCNALQSEIPHKETARTEPEEEVLHGEETDFNNSFDNNPPKNDKKKPKKKQVDKTIKPPKKCRGRLGLERKASWCKPCRNKKKCIAIESTPPFASPSLPPSGSPPPSAPASRLPSSPKGRPPSAPTRMPPPAPASRPPSALDRAIASVEGGRNVTEKDIQILDKLINTERKKKVQENERKQNMPILVKNLREKFPGGSLCTIFRKDQDYFKKLFSKQIETPRHRLFVKKNNIRLLNNPERQMPRIFSETQITQIYHECSSYFEEVNGHIAESASDILYLSYVIIPEVEIYLVRMINDYSSNDQAEKYIFETFDGYMSEDSTFEP